MRTRERFLRGEGRYLDDLDAAGLLHVGFVRSQIAHGAINSVDVAGALRLPGVIAAYSGADLVDRLPALAPSKADGGVFEPLLFEVLGDSGSFIRREHRTPVATDKVRHVGEIVATVVASDRHILADALELVSVDITEQVPVIDPEESLAPGAPLLYEAWPDNRSLVLRVGKGDVGAAFDTAAVVTRRRLHSGRLSANPIEPRGVMADYDIRTERLTVWSSTQIPHPVRTFLADALGIAAGRIRVIAPDVGGGFGCKAIPYPEELLCALCALELRQPVKWVETRWEHLTSSIHSRDQIHDISISLDSEGRILGLRDRFLVDCGAANPLGVVQPYNTIAHLCGCYEVPALEATAVAVVTNKAPLSPYRGAGRPEAVFAMERILDAAAREAGIDRFELRRRNLIAADAMPYEVGISYRDGNPVVYDSGDYPAVFEMALAGSSARPASDSEAAGSGGASAGSSSGGSARSGGRAAVSERSRRVGVGVAGYVEGTGVGPFEGALIRIDETGGVTVAVGACPQGQGHHTVFRDLAACALGVERGDVRVVTGDTDAVPYGWGTLASRSAVVAGSAIVEACAELQERILAAVADEWEIDAADLQLASGEVRVVGTPSRSVTLAEVAHAFGPGGRFALRCGTGLEAQSYWSPPTVTFANGYHLARVAVDVETGAVEVLDYKVVHDCGPMLNTDIVEGQIIGGVAQGIGAALYEEVRYDGAGQPLNANLGDYAIPSACEMLRLEIAHIETPSALNPLGIKGVGEAGAISPPAAIANAVEDALAGLGVRIDRVPITPSYLLGRLRAGSDAHAAAAESQAV